MGDSSQDQKNQDVGLLQRLQIKCKKRDRPASEERLIKAGLEIFSKHGFGGATTKLIAKKADVNESLIGRYFDGKEGLFIAIVKSFLEEMTDRELPFPPQKSLSAELEMFIRDRIDMCSMHEDFARIIFSQALVDKKFSKRVRETVPLKLDEKLVSRVQLLAEAGKLVPGADVKFISQSIDTFMDGLFFFDLILHEKPKELVLERALQFSKDYARLYERN